MKALKKIWEAITTLFIALAVLVSESKEIDEYGDWGTR